MTWRWWIGAAAVITAMARYLWIAARRRELLDSWPIRHTLVEAEVLERINREIRLNRRGHFRS